MSTKRDSSPGGQGPGTPTPTHPPKPGPFSSLEDLREKLPSGPAPAAKEPPKPKGPARAVVRYERKHRGGKEVTLVEKLDLKPVELEQWCKALKQSLGVGGFVEESSIVLQGDLRTRLPDLLTKKGVAKVTVS